MTNTSILIGLAILYAVSAAMAFYWGFTYAQTKYQLTDITKYLHKKFPDKCPVLGGMCLRDRRGPCGTSKAL